MVHREPVISQIVALHIRDAGAALHSAAVGGAPSEWPTSELQDAPGSPLVVLSVGRRQLVQGGETGPMVGVPRSQHLEPQFVPRLGW